MSKIYDRAKELFAKNPKQDVYYFTSDGNPFKAKHYAEDWASRLKDSKITTVRRELLQAISKRIEKPSDIDHKVNQDDLDSNPELVDQGVKVGDVIQIPSGSDDQNDTDHDTTASDETKSDSEADASESDDQEKEQTAEDVERAELVAKHTELFGKAPAWNISLAKLRTAVADKQADQGSDAETN